MATYSVFKETTLPGSLIANSIYLIAPTGQPDYLEIYVTNNAGTAQRRIPTQADIQTLINNSMSGASNLQVVADIAARDALVLSANTQVLVLNASADATVTSGAATYIYNHATTSFTKISEAESMDVTLAWANITGKPNSSVSAIDAAVTASHTHANKTQLDKVGEVSGEFAYNGQEFVKAGVAGW